MVDPCGILYTLLTTGCYASRQRVGLRNVRIVGQHIVVRSGDTQCVGTAGIVW